MGTSRSAMLEIIPARARDGTNLDLFQGGLIQDTPNVLIMLKNENYMDWSYIHGVHSLKPCAGSSHTALASVTRWQSSKCQDLGILVIRLSSSGPLGFWG